MSVEHKLGVEALKAKVVTGEDLKPHLSTLLGQLDDAKSDIYC